MLDAFPRLRVGILESGAGFVPYLFDRLDEVSVEEPDYTKVRNKKLASEYLSGNKVSDIGPLAALTKLSSLSLNHNQIKDVSALAKVTRLSTLDLEDNQIESVAPLAKQTELSILMLRNNKIADLAPLAAACKADAEGQKRFAPYLRLYIEGNPLSEAAKSKQIPELQGYGIRINPKDD